MLGTRTWEKKPHKQAMVLLRTGMKDCMLGSTLGKLGWTAHMRDSMLGSWERMGYMQRQEMQEMMGTLERTSHYLRRCSESLGYMLGCEVENLETERRHTLATKANIPATSLHTCFQAKMGSLD